jgi:hypothetical protein
MPMVSAIIASYMNILSLPDTAGLPA